MQKYPVPDNEIERLATLRSLDILDTPPDERFDRITRIAAAVFDVDCAFVSLVDADRQWFKSSTLPSIKETPRADSICNHAILGYAPYIVEDTLLEPSLHNIELVSSEPHVRFYAGIPLTVKGQYNVGTLCILDTKPRKFSKKDIKVLTDLATIVLSAINATELRKTTAQLYESEKILLQVAQQLKENERINSIRNETLERIVNSQPLTNILESIIKSVELEYPKMKCSILLLDKSGQYFEQAIGPSLPDFYNQAIKGLEINYGVGSCGTAAFIGERVVIEDIAAHPFWAAFTDLTNKASLAACWSEPIINSKSQVLGTFGIYHHEVCKPSASDYKLIEQSAHLASIAIEREQTNDIIKRQANYDSLTKLPNRSMMREHLNMAIHNAHRHQQKLAVIFIDLDHFKDVNDTLGHDIGDALLIETAKRLKLAIRENDIVARLGGDEFVIILVDIDDVYGVELVAEQLIKKLSKPYQLMQKVVHSSASLGITIFPDDASDIDSLLKNADQAMYGAKAQGRNGYHYFTESMREHAHNRVQLIADIRTAIEKKQFHLVFQPIVDLKTGEIAKAETLIRWQHPEKGAISPFDFIPLAEETGLIIDISNWIFQQVVQHLSYWRKTYCSNLQISINTSPVQYRDGENSISQWLFWLQKSKLSPEAIAIEITENLLMESENYVADKLAKFRHAGISISIDDFGTGYSSFSYLKSFQTDYLKIDKSFVQNMSLDSQDMVLCEAIIVMAKKLNIQVIAEGIETEEQKRLLQKIGCDYAQGYLFSRPIPADEFEALLSQKNTHQHSTSVKKP
ncbi:EAL domain-containing protein [Colwelliaceae bacterium 6471]